MTLTATTEEVERDSARVLADGEGYSCIVTEYAGNEQDVLRLRNANRDNLETREYLDWRYQRPTAAPNPRVFWLVSATGERVGMASLIFRPYWHNGCLVYAGVLGDISVAQSLRGCGLGQRLLRFATEYLNERFPDCPGFVLPNEAARKSLAAVGWRTVGKLVPHVLAVDPTQQLRALLRGAWLAERIGEFYRKLARLILRRHVTEGCMLQFIPHPDESIDDLWREFPKDSRVMRDLSAKSLYWRYATHPHLKFTFAKLLCGTELRAYMVFTLDAQLRTCFVYDFLAKSTADFACLLALYATECMASKDLSTLRISISDTHPLRRVLRTLGFMARVPATAVQVSGCGATVEGPTYWSVTSGDKDV